jgi:hypothetical protein
MAQPQSRQQLPPPNPTLFNQVARFVRQNMSSLSFTCTDVSAAQQLTPIDLPSVGYHYRVFNWFDGLLTVGDITSARLRSNDNIANTNLRFPAPWGFVKRSRYTINGSSDVWNMPGYENFLLQMASNRGRKPIYGLDVWGSSVTGSRGFGGKEALFAITSTAGTTPLFTSTFLDQDSALTDSTDLKIRFMLSHPLTLGESAVAGLLPVQDYRIKPQLLLEIGNVGDMVVNPTNATPYAGTIYTVCDYFEAPRGVRPDTRFVKQSRFQTEAMSGTGQKKFAPQLGGVMLRTFISLWHGSATGTSMYAQNLKEQVSNSYVVVQQNTTLEKVPPAFRAHDELRWYSKLMPHNVLTFDHVASGFGDPGMPSLRDRIESGKLTFLEYQWDQDVLTTAGEWRAVFEQLLPLGKIVGA